MKMRSLIGLFVAVAVTAGSGAVHAIKLVTGEMIHPGHKTEARSTFTYAKETLLKSSGKTTDSGDLGDTTTYYNIVPQHIVSGPADISGRRGDTLLVSYVLRNMVFSASLNDASIVVTSRLTEDVGGVTVPNNDEFGNPQLGAAKDNALVKVSGGAIGDSTVVFRASTETGAPASIETSDVIALTASFAIAGDGSGSITRTVLNRALEGSGVASSKAHVLPSAIRALPALRETIKPNESGPVASVDFDFKVFRKSTAATKKLADWVGYVQLGVVTTPAAYRHAQFVTAGEIPSTVTRLRRDHKRRYDNHPEWLDKDKQRCRVLR